MRTGFLLAVALISAIIFLPVSSGAEGWYSVQVGALGDTPANGSAGIRVQIQTISYPVHKPDLSDSFWVGNTLTDGAFIQFGYQIEPGYFCLRGQVANGTNTCSGGAGLVGESDARWFWQYWPDAKGPDYYYAKGPAGSVGSSGEWHTYAIVPNHENGWNFELDGVHVDSLHAEWSLLNSPPYVVAEKLTYSAQPGSLGPVQFRQLQYLQQEDKGSMVWKNDNLIALIHG
ncbi:MAG TPA: hypothetical protein VLV18_10900, partial [Terriglobales bacterium]|nr:hypothetical protein [Terriglobales bacterium]